MQNSLQLRVEPPQLIVPRFARQKLDEHQLFQWLCFGRKSAHGCMAPGLRNLAGRWEIPYKIYKWGQESYLQMETFPAMFDYQG